MDTPSTTVARTFAISSYRRIRSWRPRSSEQPQLVSAPSRCRRNLGVCSGFSCRRRERGACWRSARLADTVRSTLRAHCRPDGRLISLELDERHAQVARENLSHAGLADRAEVRVGAALDLLPALTADAPFDLAFIDADKEFVPGISRVVCAARSAGRDDRRRQCPVPSRHHAPRRRRCGRPRDRRHERSGSARPSAGRDHLPTRDGRDGVLLAVVRAEAAPLEPGHDKQ